MKNDYPCLVLGFSTCSSGYGIFCWGKRELIEMKKLENGGSGSSLSLFALLLISLCVCFLFSYSFLFKCTYVFKKSISYHINNILLFVNMFCKRELIIKYYLAIVVLNRYQIPKVTKFKLIFFS